jgi:hypothetical protein
MVYYDKKLWNLIMIKETFNKFSALIHGLNNNAVKDAFLNFQKSLEYCIEENNVMREVLRDKYHCKKIPLTTLQKKRLANKTINLNKHILEDIIKIFQPKTVIGWQKDLIGKKYDSTASRDETKRGPKITPPEVVAEVLKLARRNPEWGYERIASCIKYLGFKISKSTIKRILLDYGLTPDPDQKNHIEWERFISAHKDVLAATDFFTVELLTEQGLQRCMVLFFIDIGTREVKIAGIQNNPDGQWMEQMARNLTDPFDGFLIGKKYLIHDRDSLYTKKFCKIMEGSGITPKRLPGFRPVMNSFAETFVKTIKTECLNKLILTSEAQLRYVLRTYENFYNTQRPHRGLGGKMIKPLAQEEDGEIVEFNYLGGLLRSYRRVKQAA